MQIEIETEQLAKGAAGMLWQFIAHANALAWLLKAGSILNFGMIEARLLFKLSIPLLIVMFGMTTMAYAQSTPDEDSSKGCRFWNMRYINVNGNEDTHEPCYTSTESSAVKIYSKSQYADSEHSYREDGSLERTKPFYGFIEEGETVQFVFGITVGGLTDFDLKINISVTTDGKFFDNVTYSSVTLSPNLLGRSLATLDIPTIDDCEAEHDGSIVVRILPDGQNGKLYVEDEYNETEVVTVKDNDTFPELLIAAESYDSELGYAVVEGQSADFQILIAGSPHCVDIAVTLGVSFAGAFSDEAIQQIEFVFEANRHSQTLSIETLNDDVSEVGGSVTVSIGDGASYNVVVGEDTATIAIVDDDSTIIFVAPAVDFSQDFDYHVMEGESAKFVIGTNTVAPLIGISVNLKISLFGNFFPNYEPLQSIELKANQTLREFSIATEEVAGRQADGTIIVTIEIGGGYTIALSPQNTAVVRIIDKQPKPRLSIVPAGDQMSSHSAFEGEQAEFKIESSMPLPDVVMAPVVQILQFVGGQEVISSQTVILSRNESTKNFSITLGDDDIQTENSRLIVTIMEGNFYLKAPSPNDQAELTVLEDDVVVSISINQPVSTYVPGNQTIFSIHKGEVAVLRVSTPFPVNRQVLVRMEVEYENFYPSNSKPHESYEFALSILPGELETTELLPTSDDEMASGSQIHIRLQSDPAYTFPSQNYVLRLLDEGDMGDIPHFSIEKMDDPVIEGEYINLVLRSESMNWGDPISVRLAVSQTGDFLDWLVPKSITLKRLQQDVNFRLLTKLTWDNEQDGTVTVAVLPSLSSGTYTINANKSRVDVAVQDSGQTTPPSINEPKYSVASHVIHQVLLQNGTTNMTPTQTFAEPKKFPRGEDSRTIPTFSGPKLPEISIVANSSEIVEGSTIHFQAISNVATVSSLTVNVELSASGGSIALTPIVSVQIPKGETESSFSIFVEDDGIAQEDSIISAKIAQGSGYSVDLDDGGIANVRVLDATAKMLRQVRYDEINSANQVAFSNLQENSNLRVLNAANSRISQAFNGSSNTLNTGDGLSSFRDSLLRVEQTLNSNVGGKLELLNHLSTEVALFPEEGSTELATVWGKGDSHAFKGNKLHDKFNFNSTMISGYLGMDSQFGNGILGGIATSVTEADAKISTSEEEFEYQFSSRGIHSYLAWNSMSGTERFQSVAGMEFGDLKIDQEGYNRERAESLSYMFALSDSRLLYSSESMFEGGVFELKQGNQFLASSNHLVGSTDFIENMDSTNNSWRSELSGSYETKISEEIEFTPTITASILRYDNAVESHFDFALGGHAKLRHSSNLIFVGKGEVAVSQDSEYNKNGLSGTLEFAKEPNGQGLQLSLNSEWGQLSDNLFTSQSEFGEFDFIQSNSLNYDNSSLGIEIGYGIENSKYEGLLTPYTGLNLYNGIGKYFHLGGRYRTNTGIGFELGASRIDSETGNVRHEINLTGNVNW